MTEDHQRESGGAAPVWSANVPHTDLRRDLSTRQVSMITIGGTIGTGIGYGALVLYKIELVV